MKRVAIDMDEVIADANQRFADWYHRDFGEVIAMNSLNGVHFENAVPAERRKIVSAYPSGEGFFKNLPVMADAQDVILELSKKYEIYITTAAMQFPSSFVHKFEWLAEHFPFIPWTNIVFCGDKGIINADYLIDDHSHHFRFFSGQGILFTSPHNVHEDWNPRVNNWKEVAALLL